MRPNPILLITILLFLYLSSFSQETKRYDLLLKTGTVIPEKNIDAARLNDFNNKALRADQKAFVVLQFETLPSEEEKARLKQAGIELLDYIPHNAFTATISGPLNESILTETNARALVELSPVQKMHSAISSGLFPSWSVKIKGTVDVWISFPKTFTYEEVKKELLGKNFDIISSLHKNYQILALRVSATRVFELASYPFVEYVQPAPGEDKPLNGWTNWNRDGSKATKVYDELLAALPSSAVGRGEFQIIQPCEAWPGNPTTQNFIIVQWQSKAPAFDLVVVNLAAHRSQCYAPLTVPDLAEHNWTMRDRLGTEKHERFGADLASQGLYLDLPEWGAQLFHFEPLR